MNGIIQNIYNKDENGPNDINKILIEIESSIQTVVIPCFLDTKNKLEDLTPSLQAAADNNQRLTAAIESIANSLLSMADSLKRIADSLQVLTEHFGLRQFLRIFSHLII